MLKSSSLIVIGFFVFGATLYAGDKHNHAVNIIKTDKDSNVALCACDKKVMVTDTTPKVMADDMTYYVCSDGCQAKFSENIDTIKPILDKKVKKAKMKSAMMGNVYKVNTMDEKVAKCACGMDVTVTDETVSRMHNDHRYYMCSEKCAEHFDENPEKFIKVTKEKSMKKDMQEKEF